jgi:predicted HTH domain antitoxin
MHNNAAITLLSRIAVWYSRGEISQEKAAGIAGMDRADFLLTLAREGLEVFQVDFQDLKKELARG